MLRDFAQDNANRSPVTDPNEQNGFFDENKSRDADKESNYATDGILEDFLVSRHRHHEAREQLRHLLNTFVRPHKQ